MHYYQFNIGDYLSHTRHLSPIEDICYRRSLDYYYLHEKPLPLDINYLARVLMLSEYGKQLAVVLNEFFENTENGYINSRADKEIQQYQGFAEAGKRGAAKRWSKDANSPPNSPPNPPPIANNNHKPITINHKPVTNEQSIVELPLDPVTEKPKLTGKANLVFEYWQQVMEHPRAIMDAKRKRAIDARIKDGYTVEQLKLAIDGCKKSDFHQGANDRNQVFDDIELICRTASNVDKFIKLATEQSLKLSANGKKTLNAAHEWLERGEK